MSKKVIRLVNLQELKDIPKHKIVGWSWFPNTKTTDFTMMCKLIGKNNAEYAREIKKYLDANDLTVGSLDHWHASIKGTPLTEDGEAIYLSNTAWAVLMACVLFSWKRRTDEDYRNASRRAEFTWVDFYMTHVLGVMWDENQKPLVEL